MIGSTYIDFDKAQKTGLKLIRTGENPTFGLLIICGINLGLRISDLLTLDFEQLKAGKIGINEKKTGKKRFLDVNDNITTALKYFKDDLRHERGGMVFVSQKGTIYSQQHVNRLIKKYFKGERISSHSLRKTFGRRVWENNGESEKALMYLSDIFQHSSIAETRKYLGITASEITDIYMNL
ncbi:phage integrase family protein [Cellulophaga phage phi46:1]|uniref:phage integrase family protein n=1 Tax=Cellulophaga phage phi46:1 TaxID=1327974 RepID=UPI000351C802|nr:phage integrase family protein [Cellulophaga phage phi46:1]AGO47864.1 phage integrase family protein [Cellulophaga phage phi46:1]